MPANQSMVIGGGGAMMPPPATMPGLRYFPWANNGRWDVAYCVPGTNTKHSLMSCPTLGSALAECRRLNGEPAHA